MMISYLHSAQTPPSPALPSRGRVRIGDFEQIVAETLNGTSPLEGEAGRGGGLPSIQP
ncbi:hypothetical protein SAMN04488059_103194 [Devosia psychrophila]|uniref:Uncharacterized protein n=1 Tax=Devosia psychrophila TaxID=728005 RepID=A0A1I1HZM9_9HYPH|nr:hypothetical protein SAMN04488059_103194 [Devosia psychrophila]